MARKKFLSRNWNEYKKKKNYAAYFNVSFLDVVSEIVQLKMIYAGYWGLRDKSKKYKIHKYLFNLSNLRNLIYLSESEDVFYVKNKNSKYMKIDCLKHENLITILCQGNRKKCSMFSFYAHFSAFFCRIRNQSQIKLCWCSRNGIF
jgi:hypothetical protein